MARTREVRSRIGQARTKERADSVKGKTTISFWVDTESAALQRRERLLEPSRSLSRNERPPSCRTFGREPGTLCLGILNAFKWQPSSCPHQDSGTGFSAPSGQTEDRGDSPTSLARGESFDNDPPAGSPTGTLLRLLFPLNDQVRTSFRHVGSTLRPNRQPIRSPH